MIIRESHGTRNRAVARAVVRLLPRNQRHLYAIRMPTRVRDLIKQLELDGWVQVRQRGSHRQFRHPSKTGTVTVAGKESADVPTGTLNSVLKHAGLKQAARTDGCSEENDA